MIPTPQGVLVKLAWKLAPWALVAVMGLALWGAYGYVTAAREAQRVAREELAKEKASKAELERQAKEHGKILAEREVALAKANETINAQRRTIRGFKPNEDCLALDGLYPWLDGMLSRRAPVQPTTDR